MICSVSDGLYQGRLDCIALLLDVISLFLEAVVLSGKIFSAGHVSARSVPSSRQEIVAAERSRDCGRWIERLLANAFGAPPLDADKAMRCPQRMAFCR
jgi:hypothetical protein